MTLTRKEVVTNFLRYQDKILILRRSDKVGTYKGVWAGVSGYLEKNDIKPIERAIIEIIEETGLSRKHINLVKEGKTLEIVDEDKNILWIVHPFLWDIFINKIKIDWEHKELKWIKTKEELDHIETVPNLKETLETVL